MNDPVLLDRIVNTHLRALLARVAPDVEIALVGASNRPPRGRKAIRAERLLTTKRFWPVLAAIAISVGVAACNGGGAGTSPPAAPGSAANPGAGSAPGSVSPAKPCDLIAQSDAEAAVGQSLSTPKEDVTLGNCTYLSTDFAAGVQFTVSTWDAVKTAAQGATGDKPPIAVSGLGDEALHRDRGPLYVRKGNRGILLVINGPQVDSLPDHGLSRAEDLARTILPKL